MAKYCTRCNKGIYTAWRTLDEKKYYHPHCFTCAVCNVILECVQECGVPNLKEIYCKKCYKECLRGGENINDWLDESKTMNDGQGEEIVKFQNPLPVLTLPFPRSSSEVPPSLPPPPPIMFKQPSFQQGRNALGLTFPSQFSQMQQNPENEAPFQFSNKFENQAAIPFSDKFENENPIPVPMSRVGNNNKVPAFGQHETYMIAQLPHSQSPEIFMVKNESNSRQIQKLLANEAKGKELAQDRRLAVLPTKFDVNNNNTSNSKAIKRLESVNSRIPRPTASSLSKKSLLAEFAPPDPSIVRSKSRVRMKQSKNQLPSSTSNKAIGNNARPRPPPIPPRMQRSVSLVQPRVSRHTNNLSPQPGNAKSSKSLSQTRSASNDRNHQHSTTSSRVPKTVPSKRQCAASFAHYDQCRNFQTEITKNRRPSEAYAQDQQYYKQTKMEVPTAQTILSVMRKERSDLSKPHVNTQSKLGGDENGNSIGGPSRTAIVPKRNFNITFDCPICISSLVPGTSDGPCPKGARGNVVTICGHLFHRKCLENWLKLKGNKRCPLCSALCLPETLQPVYLESNVSVETQNTKHTFKGSTNFIQANKNIGNKNNDSAYLALRYEHDQLKRKYNAMIQDKNNYSLNVTIANSLQRAYDMECRNRLQLQWENKKLQQQIQELLQQQQPQKQILP